MVGSLLILVFFSWLDVLPSVALDPARRRARSSKPDALVLPVLTLLGVTLAASIRMVRAGMLEALARTTCRWRASTATASGVVVRRYALRNALAPSVQVFALNIQYLIGGIIVVETCSPIPGIGKELVDAVAIRDVREVQSLAVARRGDLHHRSTSSPTCSWCCSCRGCGRRCDATRSPAACASPAPARGAVGLGHPRGWSLLIALVGPCVRAPRPRRVDRHPARAAAPPTRRWATDFLGRDVLSRVLWGGRSVFELAGAATLLAYVVGAADRPRRRLHAARSSTRC